MKKLILLITLFISSITLSAEEARTALDKTAKAKAIKVLDLNDELHMSFFEYNGDKVAKAAKKLRTAMASVNNKDLKKLFTPALKSLDGIKAKGDRQVNNELFHEASKTLVYLVNKFDVGPGYNEYTCPMVAKKWVQNSKKRARVHNPYAPEMPHCGGQVTDY